MFAIGGVICYNRRMDELTPDQKDAEELIKEWFFNLDTQIFVLCGYAGTGKTYLIDHAVRALGLTPGKSAVFVAPTGKAASVLLRSGTPAGTVHSLIYTREEDIDVDENGEVISERFLRFVRKEKIDSDIKLIVVDETSMVSDEVLRDLLSFGVKCLFSGDPAQLPPVGGTNTLLSMPCASLTRIVRQEEGNPIVRLASMARAGKILPFGNYGESVSVLPKNSLTPAARRRLLLEADQVIVGTNRTRENLNREVRAYLGISASAVLPVEGEKLICTLNNWSKKIDERGEFHLVNGIIGVCRNVEEGEDGLGKLDFKADFLEKQVEDLPFDTGIFREGRYYHGYGDKACFLQNGALVHENSHEMLRMFKVKREDTVCRFEFAYAVTCHKAQGSEYDFVVVFDESRIFDDGARWLYTAITRAKKKLVILR